MKKTYAEPRMIVEDFSLSDAIAAKSCKYTENTILLTTQMAMHPEYGQCAKINEMTGQEALDYQNFSQLYDGSFDVNNNSTWGDKGDLMFTALYRASNPGNCLVDPFKQNVVFGQNNAGSPCLQPDWESGNDTSLLQNS